MSEHPDTTDTTRMPTEDREPADTPTWWEQGRHPVNVAHLVTGLLLAGFLGVWALLWTGAADSGDVRWLLPVPWLVAGAAGLLVAGRGARRRTEWE